MRLSAMSLPAHAGPGHQEFTPSRDAWVPTVSCRMFGKRSYCLHGFFATHWALCI
jgi:hypothetical protein